MKILLNRQLITLTTYYRTVLNINGGKLFAIFKMTELEPGVEKTMIGCGLGLDCILQSHPRPNWLHEYDVINPIKNLIGLHFYWIAKAIMLAQSSAIKNAIFLLLIAQSKQKWLRKQKKMIVIHNEEEKLMNFEF